MAIETEAVAFVAFEHVVQIYDGEDELVRQAGAYLSTAVLAGDVAIIIATDAHRRVFEQELESSGVDLVATQAAGNLVLRDAAMILAACMVAGRLDREAFSRCIDEIVGSRLAIATRRVRVYGEMVALLWQAGDVMAAIELESCWNKKSRELSFSLLCAYPLDAVSGSEHVESLRLMCQLHSSVRHARPPEPVSEKAQVREATADFAAGLGAPRAARQFVVDTLKSWGYVDDIVDDAALVVTELASNVVLHVGSQFSVGIRARDHDGAVRLSVGDGAPVRLVPAQPTPSAESGRGLGIVDAIASRWGVEIRSDTKTVWAELTPVDDRTAEL